MQDSDRRRVHAYLDGELSPAAQEALLCQAREDAALGAYITSMKAVQHRLRTLQTMDDPLPRFRRPAVARSSAMGLRVLAAAAILLGCAGIWWGLSVSEPTAPAPAVNAAVEFAYVAPNAGEVQIAGDFTDWKPIGLHQSGDRWTTNLRLSPGRYTYMYVVDGRWTTDPKAHSFRDDEFGRRNAVLHL